MNRENDRVKKGFLENPDMDRSLSRRELIKRATVYAGAAIIPSAGCSVSQVRPRQLKQRAIILGFDGVSPYLLRQYMDQGHLPNLAALAGEGTFTELATSNPPESPVAWSNFSVCAQPGVHGIYDFLTRDLSTYTPKIATVDPVDPEFLWDTIPLSPPRAKSRQTGKHFWKHAAENGIRTAVIQAPVAFPPEDLEAEGVMLCGLCTPDLRGTQATYHFFTTDIYNERAGNTEFGGKISALEFDGEGRAGALIYGPWNPVTRQKSQRLLKLRNEMAAKGGSATVIGELDRIMDALKEENYLTVPIAFRLDREQGTLTVVLQGRRIVLTRGRWSEWVQVKFSVNLLLNVYGLCRFLATEIGEQVKVFMSPLEIHPEKPVLKISFPEGFSKELVGRVGLYKTRGWAAETAALKERKINEKAFLEDLHQIIDKREQMAISVLEKERPNLFIEVFSCTDRVQHMFWRLIDKGHPMYDPEAEKEFGNAILDVYRRMDEIVGKIRQRFEDQNTLLMVLSDHGFHSFRKGVNLNTWLVSNGYMRLQGQDDPRYKLADLFGGGDFFVNVDWSRTRAYSLGLGLVFVNLKGREAGGIVEPGAEYKALLAEMAVKLEALRDPEDDARVVSHVYAGRQVYRGARVDEAPDLVVGFNENYRVSWQTALGGIPQEIIEPNLEKWSGDHCSFDHAITRGVFLANRKGLRPDPDLRDIGPTVLKFLGLTVPGEYEGRDLLESAV